VRGTVGPKVVRAVLIGASLLGAPAAASAATYTVTSTADSTAPCVGTTCPSLRAAIGAANGDPGSTIKLGAASYNLGRGPGLVVGTGELQITADMTIAGAGSGATSIVQSDGAHRVIKVLAGTVTLSGLRVTGGKLTGTPGSPGSPTGGPGGSAEGGGIDNAGDLTLLDVVVSGNFVTGGGGGPGSTPGNGGPGGGAFGAGIASSGPLAMVSSSVSGNTATGGLGEGASRGTGGAGGNALGGLYIIPLSPGQANLRASTISNNIAIGGAGGAAVFSPGTPGSGGDATGGISQWSQTLTLQDSTVSGNSATGGTGGEGISGPNASGGGDAVGGGLALIGGSLRLERSTVSGNRGTGGDGGAADATTGGRGGSSVGGGLYVQSNAAIVNATVFGNSAGAGAGGLPFGGGGTIGSPGVAFGGGLYDAGGAGQTVTLASVTLATNAAQTGGNVWDGTTHLVVSDTLIDDGTASTGPNCVTGSVTDNGHNLDSTTPTECLVPAGTHDLIGVNPGLGALGVHGGSTATMPLSVTSPARGAGGACVDPSNESQPLTVDQRGLPRPVPCDIGAFQTEPPANTSPPGISGAAVGGGTLTCGAGAWLGDGPLSFAFQWLRDGTAIASATAATYRAARSDIRRRLSCRVTATGVYGQRSAVSGAVMVSPPRFGGSTLLGKRLKLDKHGNVIVRVGCSAAAPGGQCVDAAALYASSGKLPATLSRRTRTRKAASFGKARFSLRAGGHQTERIHLTRAGLRLVHGSTSVRLRLILASRDAFGDRQTRVYRVVVAR
jgi:hypothetical protein